jgi:hypothetical protein
MASRISSEKWVKTKKGAMQENVAYMVFNLLYIPSKIK